MNRLRKESLLCLMILGSTLVLAQSPSLSSDYILKHWTVDDGLPVNEIVNITQTQDGYIWLATFDGLVRFDGDQFTVFNSGNISAFPTNRFTELQVDRHKNLWILTEMVQNNEVLIAYHDGQFKVFGPEFGLEGNLNLQLDREGNLLVGSDNGAFYYDGKTLQSFGDELKGKTVRKIAHNAEGVYWFATDEGAFQHDDGDWIQFTEQDGLDSRNTLVVHVDFEDKVWIGTDAGVNVLENGTMTSHVVNWQFSGNRNQNIYESHRSPGQIFLVKGRRFIQRFEHGRFLYYPKETNQYAYRLGIAIDSSGTVWAQMQNKVFREGELVYTAQSPVNQLFTDQAGNIWVAQNDGLTQLKSRLTKSYSKNISVVYPITEDQEGVVWATHTLHGLFQLQGATFREVTDQAEIPQKAIYSLYASSDGMLWIGAKRGVFRWDKKTPVQWLKPPVKERGSSNPMPEMVDIKAIQEDAMGNMWFGGTNGIHQLDKNGDWHHIGKMIMGDYG